MSHVVTMRAVVADPSRFFRHLLKRTLAERGFDVVEAAGAADTLATVQEAPVDLVCMAMNLPDSTGADLCLRLRERKELARVPMVVLTSSETADATRRSLAAGVTELFRKQDLEDFARYAEGLADSLRRRGNLHGTILFLEDSRSVALQLRRALEGAGYAVDHFGSAEQGIEAFAEGEYDLVLTDILLEGSLTGMSVLEAVRAHPDPLRRTTPVVAMSGYNEPARRLQLFDSGVNDYVNKPVLEQELIARVNNLVGNRRLIARLAESYERIEQMALSDQLTGLRNRHYLAQHWPGLVERLGARPLGLVLMDLDHFKQVNDRHGHDRGDEVLRQVGRMLREQAGRHEGAVGARLGGEEFLLVLPAMGLEDASRLAEELRMTLREARPGGVEMSASFGVAARGPGEDYDALFKRADLAAYEAKRGGRDRVEIAPAST